MRGHVGEAIEVAVNLLLVAASGIKLDHLDEHWVEEIGDGGIVECEMAVLTDARAHDVGRLSLEEVFIILAGLERTLDLLAGDEPESVGR